MDPSQASINANQPEQTETITCMDCDSYNAAVEGKIEFFKDITDHKSLNLLLTPNKNTVLHIYITALNFRSTSTTSNAGSKSTKTHNAGSESKTNFVEKILNMCHSLLRQANAKGQTPLQIAARYGHDDIVEVLIKYCAQTLRQDLEGGIEPVKEMLMMKNKEKDTALHEAVRYNHLKVVELLIREDPDFSYSANDAGETPLYIAGERRFKDVLFEILDKCKSPTYEGPLGRTALHAAIICDSTDMTSKILEKIEAISRKVDNNGWTPLHLAAYYDSGNSAKLLLDKDREVAYMKDTEGRTALHIAAQCDNPSTMLYIVSSCPDCCELVDNRGWNVLHFVMKESCFLENFIIIILRNSSLSTLLNEKNADGDTPLHYYARSSESANNFLHHPQVDKMAFNKKNLNALDIALTNAAQLPLEKMMEISDALDQLPHRVITNEDQTPNRHSWIERYKDKKNKDRRLMLSMLPKATEVHLVVAALIATVTFAACITMPGGFAGGGEGSHPGSALLRKNAAFKAFVITDTISMVFSSSAVFIHLLLPFLFDKDINDEKNRMKLVFLAFILILGAMVAMGLAFVTGTYAVLGPSLDLAIANCIIGLTFFAIFPLVFRKILGSSFFQIVGFFDL